MCNCLSYYSLQRLLLGAYSFPETLQQGILGVRACGACKLVSETCHHHLTHFAIPPVTATCSHSSLVFVATTRRRTDIRSTRSAMRQRLTHLPIIRLVNTILSASYHVAKHDH